MKYLLLALVTGCMPYALPPVTADLGPSRSSERGSRTGLHANVGFSPLHFSRATRRPFDATIGASYDHEGGKNLWGASASAGPVFQPWPGPSLDRLLPQIVGRWSTDGTALGVRVALERATFTSGRSSDHNGGAYRYGEAAFGFYLEADVRFRDEREWMVTGGIAVRIPAIFGVACCLH